MNGGIMLTTTQAAARAGVSRPTLSRALKNGELPGIRGNSGRWMIDPDELDAWNANRSSVHNDERLNSVHERIENADFERLNGEIQALRADLAETRQRLARAEGEGSANRERIADLIAERERILAMLEARPVRVGLWARIFGR